jgi:hypothetical protein
MATGEKVEEHVTFLIKVKHCCGDASGKFSSSKPVRSRTSRRPCPVCPEPRWKWTTRCFASRRKTSSMLCPITSSSIGIAAWCKPGNIYGTILTGKRHSHSPSPWTNQLLSFILASTLTSSSLKLAHRSFASSRSSGRIFRSILKTFATSLMLSTFCKCEALKEKFGGVFATTRSKGGQSRSRVIGALEARIMDGI